MPWTAVTRRRLQAPQQEEEERGEEASVERFLAFPLAAGRDTLVAAVVPPLAGAFPAKTAAVLAATDVTDPVAVALPPDGDPVDPPLLVLAALGRRYVPGATAIDLLAAATDDGRAFLLPLELVERLSGSGSDGAVEDEEEETLCEAVFDARGVGHGVVVSALAFDEDAATLVLALTNGDVHVVDVDERMTLMVLQGHTSPVTDLCFLPWDPAVLVSTAVDRTFKVWDLAEGAMRYQSGVVSAHAFTCIAADPLGSTVAMGASDGRVRVFEANERTGVAPRELHRLDVGLMVHKWLARAADAAKVTAAPATKLDARKRALKQGRPMVVSSEPRWKHRAYADFDADAEDEDDAVSLLPDEPTTVYWIGFAPGDEGAMVVAVRQGLAVISTSSFELVNFAPYVVAGVTDDFGDAAAVHGCMDEESGRMRVLVDDGETGVIFIELTAEHDVAAVAAGAVREAPGGRFGRAAPAPAHVVGAGEHLEMLLAPDGLLRGGLLERVLGSAASSTASSSTSGRGKGKGKARANRPVTFQSKVRSSGYGSTAPVMKMFSGGPSQRGKGKGKGKARAETAHAYDVNCEPPSVYQARHSTDSALHQGPIFRTAYAPNAKRVALASADGTMRVLQLPVAKHTIGPAYRGHDAPVTCVEWSASSSMLITSSNDRTARVWELGRSDPCLVFSKAVSNKDPESASFRDGLVRNTPFALAVVGATFFHTDALIVAASGSGLYVYRYQKPEVDTKRNELKYLQSKNNLKYKLTAFHASSAQSITAMAAVNTGPSRYVLCCGSNKRLQVYDVDAGRVVYESVDPLGERAPAVVRVRSPSPYAEYADASNVFLTSATDGVRLWDLRAPERAILRLANHGFRTHAVGAAFSPCDRFVATGGDDRAAYLYDVRTGLVVDRMAGQSAAVVSDVDFNPKHPQLITGAHDGHARFYGDVA